MLAIINDTVAHLLLPGSDIVKYREYWENDAPGPTNSLLVS